MSMTPDDWLARADGAHALTWTGSGSGGQWRQQITRETGDAYRSELVLEHDFDSLGGASPETRVRVLSVSAARAEVALLLTHDGEPRVTPC